MTRQHDHIRSTVRDQYAKIAEATAAPGKAQGLSLIHISEPTRPY